MSNLTTYKKKNVCTLAFSDRWGAAEGFDCSYRCFNRINETEGELRIAYWKKKNHNFRWGNFPWPPSVHIYFILKLNRNTVIGFYFHTLRDPSYILSSNKCEHMAWLCLPDTIMFKLFQCVLWNYMLNYNQELSETIIQATAPDC